MKKLITTVFCLSMATCGFALGPNEINFNGIKFYKNNEKTQQNVIISEYEPANGSSSSIVLTHVIDKNDPSAIAEGLKQKKLIEVMDVQKLNPENTDVLVTFVKFDQAGSKVENNLCRITRNAGGENGSLVFQYIDKKAINKSEGSTIPDLTGLTDNLKTLSFNGYVTSMPSDRVFTPPPTRQTYSQSVDAYNSTYGNASNKNTHNNRNSYNNLPWYKRPGARAGGGAYTQRDSQPQQYRYR